MTSVFEKQEQEPLRIQNYLGIFLQSSQANNRHATSLCDDVSLSLLFSQLWLNQAVGRQAGTSSSLFGRSGKKSKQINKL